MKNELIITDNVNQQALVEITDVALQFFSNYLPKNDLSIVSEGFNFDIHYKNIELGSYGIRTCEFLTWIYGTGCAEPRLSKIIESNGLSY
jgi:hypothetical protein